MPVYAADFETTTDENDCRVWAWAICDINDHERLTYGNSIASFMEHLTSLQGKIYFHNLKFDGRFILDWLFRNGYEWFNKAKRPYQFSTLISDMNVFYSIEIFFPDTSGGIQHRIQILDSLKLMPFSIAQMAKTFQLKDQKLEIDYTAFREPGHALTRQEQEYIANDVKILAQGLKFMFGHGQRKMTTASNAMNDYKKRITEKGYKRTFPELDKFTDRDIRLSYKGGWTYLNPLYKNKDIGDGTVYDVNSMYPGVLKYKKLPFGEPIYFNGEYKPDPFYDLYVINFLCEFKIKPGHFPSIQIKNLPLRYMTNEYLTESDGPTWLTLTSVDYQLFLDHYDVKILEFSGGYMFRSRVGMFDSYIDYWYKIKTDSGKEGNSGMKQIAKLMLNSLYGKFGSRKTTRSNIPYFDPEKDLVRYRLGEFEDVHGGYVPIATFVTSYARDIIIRGAQSCGDRFVYADTDSLHIIGQDPVPGLDVDPYRLAAFKEESHFKRAKFIRQKTYLEVYENNGKEELNIKCAGMPDRIKERLKEEDFYEGAEYEGNLKARTVPGGVILAEVTYKIKRG